MLAAIQHPFYLNFVCFDFIFSRHNHRFKTTAVGIFELISQLFGLWIYFDRDAGSSQLACQSEIVCDLIGRKLNDQDIGRRL